MIKIACNLSKVSYLSDINQDALHALSFFFNSQSNPGGWGPYPHVPHKETEAQNPCFLR